MEAFPRILNMREQSDVIFNTLKKRLEEVLPPAMREAGLDMWLIICQEDDLDPVFRTMIPMDTWCPILQMLVFYDRGKEQGIEGINISMTDTHDLYDMPWSGRRHHSEQWDLLCNNIVRIAHKNIEQCYSHNAIVPGITTTEDLEWYYWQICADLGLDLAFNPFFNIVRSDEMVKRYGEKDNTIRQGDLIHCDVGIKYLRLNTDHHEWAYILREGESNAPEGFQDLLAEGNKLQDIFMNEFTEGFTGNELLKRILSRAREEGIPNPRVYSHSLGYYLHEPGPLIGLPWEQESYEGRGDIELSNNQSFTMELSVKNVIPEWDNQEVRLGLEQDVVYTSGSCRLLDGRQTNFHLI